MTTRFSIVRELKSPFGAKHMKQQIADWPGLLDGLRRMWLIGEQTILETGFSEPVKKSNNDSEKGT
jgi:hypothetical protein